MVTWYVSIDGQKTMPPATRGHKIFMWKNTLWVHPALSRCKVIIFSVFKKCIFLYIDSFCFTRHYADLILIPIDHTLDLQHVGNCENGFNLFLLCFSRHYASHIFHIMFYWWTWLLDDPIQKSIVLFFCICVYQIRLEDELKWQFFS